MLPLRQRSTFSSRWSLTGHKLDEIQETTHWTIEPNQGCVQRYWVCLRQFRWPCSTTSLPYRAFAKHNLTNQRPIWQTTSHWGRYYCNKNPYQTSTVMINGKDSMVKNSKGNEENEDEKDAEDDEDHEPEDSDDTNQYYCSGLNLYKWVWVRIDPDNYHWPEQPSFTFLSTADY